MTSKKLGLLVILAVLVFAALMGYGDFREMGQRLAQFPITYLAAVLIILVLKEPFSDVYWMNIADRSIPFVGLIVHVIMSIDIARHFGKGTGFGVGLACLVFYPILGFGSAQYGGGHDSHGMSHDMHAPTGDDQQQAA